MRILFYLLLVIVATTAVIFWRYDFIQTRLDAYAIATAQDAFGSQSLDAKQEEGIRSIIKEMGIEEPIIIRKMNHTALALFGYHNAFAYFPLFFTCIPASNKPFLFISEGFFEDLSIQEQRFIIGHELIHIQKRHTLYLNLWIYCLILGLCLIVFFSKESIKAFLAAMIPVQYQSYVFGIIITIMIGTCFVIPCVISCAYRRHIEIEADVDCLKRLGAYEGCLRFMDRCRTEFGLPYHNGDTWLFADHPSFLERSAYCKDLQKKLQG